MANDPRGPDPAPAHPADGGLGTGTKNDPAKEPAAQPGKHPAPPAPHK